MELSQKKKSNKKKEVRLAKAIQAVEFIREFYRPNPRHLVKTIAFNQHLDTIDKYLKK